MPNTYWVIARGFIPIIIITILFGSYLFVVSLNDSNSISTELVAQQEERSGPISTWPASWSNFCRIPADNVGNDTTVVNDLNTSYTEGINLTLDQLYSVVISSESFQNVTQNQGWVTTDWGTLEITGPTYSDSYIFTHFLLISNGSPDGYLTTYYNVDSGIVTANYSQEIISSCPGS